MSFIFIIKSLARLLCVVFLVASASVYGAAQMPASVVKVSYLGQGSTDGEDRRNDYYVELLVKALSRSDKLYSFEKGPRGLSALRQLYAVANGTVDVGWSFSTEENEKKLIPIRIPLDKGLIGWRLLLINREDAKMFSNIKSIDELRQIRLGQGLDWVDTSILRANQFTVEGVSTYDGIFKMLKQKRIRYFPRSILEIWAEVDEHKELDLAIENTLLIHYPAAIYFVVSLDKKALARDIESGLEAMIKDGEFDKIFNEYYSVPLKKAKLDQRRIFDLQNPYLPNAAPLNRPELWFDVTKIKR